MVPTVDIPTEQVADCSLKFDFALLLNIRFYILISFH